MKQIINSILDTDLYKMTMQQAVILKFAFIKVKYKFINRGETIFPEGFAEELKNQVKLMGKLRLTEKEKIFLSTKIPFLSPAYIEFLSGYQYDSSELKISQINGKLEIEIEGYWFRTILWEVPLMALISELYFKMTNEEIKLKVERWNTNATKIELFNMHNIDYVDMGTRRRYSYDIQDELVKQMAKAKIEDFTSGFTGTSNVHFAMKYDIKPIGTQAHEWFMVHAAKYGFKMANHMAMENWTDIYRGDLGIALPDTLTSEVFFKSFDKKFAKLYDGVRHDSGDPIKFGHKVLLHYKKLGIDPRSKTIVFSDGLNPLLVVKIKEHFKGRIKVSFGIGTNFTNDVGVTPLNMVIKVTEALMEDDIWYHTIKLSDSSGKHTGDPDTIRNAKELLNIV